MQTWFVLKSGTVYGPITSDKVLSNYNSQNVMVWGLTCSEWLSYSDWSKQLSQGLFEIKQNDSLSNQSTNSQSSTQENPEPAKVYKLKSVSGSLPVPNDDSTVVEEYVPENVSPINKKQPLKQILKNPNLGAEKLAENQILVKPVQKPSEKSVEEQVANNVSPIIGKHVEEHVVEKFSSKIEEHVVENFSPIAEESNPNLETPAENQIANIVNSVVENPIPKVDNSLEDEFESLISSASSAVSSAPNPSMSQLDVETQNLSYNDLTEQSPALEAGSYFEALEKTAIASVDLFPTVDDIIMSSTQTQEEHDKEVSDVLNDQLNNILQQPNIDDDGHTLIQAVMEDLNYELSINLEVRDEVLAEIQASGLEAEAQVYQDVQSLESENELKSENQSIDQQNFEVETKSPEDLSLDSNDGATKVQSSTDLSLDLDGGATKVQKIDEFNFDLSDGATKVQSSPVLDLDFQDGATKVQTFEESNFELNDGATKVQSSTDLSLDLDDGATKVQKLDGSIFDLSDGATKVQAYEESDLELNDGATKVQSSQELDLDFQDGATKVQSSEDLNLDLDHGATKVQNLDLNSDSDLEDQKNHPNHELTAVQNINQTSKQNIEKLNLSTNEGAFKVQKTKKANQGLENESAATSKATETDKVKVAELKGTALTLEQTKVLEKPIWYVAYDGESEGPMNVETLLKKIDKFENPEFIYIWKKGFKDWQSLYETPQISSQLGIGFRRHDRHPFTGTVKIEFKGNVQIGQLENLSISGLGATGFGPLVLGETVKVTLDCAELQNEIEFVAVIRFTSNLGVLGLSFVKTDFVENINKIIELVQSVSLDRVA